MTRLIEILISLAIVAALFLVVSLILPSGRHLREEVETNRRLTIVYDTLNSLRRFKDWNPLVLHDPGVALKLSGPESGVGARLDYSSSVRGVGNGSWEISKNEDRKSVTYAIENDQRGSGKEATFSLSPSGQRGRNVKITQDYKVDYGWNLLGRYAGLYVSRHVGDDMKLGLQRLSNMLASVPNVDYAQAGNRISGLALVQRPAEDLLVVEAGAISRDNNNEPIKAAMKSNVEWIKRTMAANGLSASGPLRIVTSELGRDTYTFDVIQPVRRGGAVPSATPAAADEATASDTTGTAAGEAAAVAADAKLTAPFAGGASSPLSVSIPAGAPVKYVRQEAGRVSGAVFTGYFTELENVRNAVRAWALTQGLEPTDRPFEIYTGGIDKAFTENGQFEVYWPVK